MSNKKYRAVNFDLNKDALEEHYSAKNPRKAYKEIKKYMLSNGFKHRQWSGYRSENKMTDIEVMKFFDAVFTHFPWLAKCARKFDVTEIGKTYDLLELYDQGLIGVSSVEKTGEKIVALLKTEKDSLDTKLKKAKDMIEKSPEKRKITKKHEISNDR